VPIIQLPGLGRSVDAIIRDACASLGIEPWGGASEDGWSKRSDFLRCPYRYYLKHVRGVGPLAVTADTEALDIGACVHLLLAAYYARMLPDERYPGWRMNPPDPQALLQALIAARLPRSIAADVEQLFDGYVEQYANDVLQPVAVEMPGGLVGTHTSRYDLVFWIEDGMHDGLWIGEHKTASPSSDLDDFRFHGEVLGLMSSNELVNLQDVFGVKLNGVCINALVKPRPKQAPRYQRLWLTFPYALISEYGSDRGCWSGWLQTCQDRNRWPKSLQGCKSYNRRCRFWEHCRTQDAGQLKPVEKC
jgi:hypothetical protein